MCERVEGRVGAVETPIGLMPREGELDLTGLDIPGSGLRELLRVDPSAWKVEVADIERHFGQFGDRLPTRLLKQLNDLRRRLG
jgi:phosphoenolpyruvate carboxykinase (GTP)